MTNDDKNVNINVTMMLNLILQTICCFYLTSSKITFSVGVIDVVMICMHEYVCVWMCIVVLVFVVYMSPSLFFL